MHTAIYIEQQLKGNMVVRKIAKPVPATKTSLLQ